MYDKLVGIVSNSFKKTPDHRKGSVEYSLHDSCMGAFAMFALKDPSLLSFVSNFAARQENLEHVFKISKVPSDNGMRKILDPVQPTHLIPIFKDLFEHLDEQNILEDRRYLDHFLISVDGTGTYSSNVIGCSHCLTKNHKNGNVEYHHQLLGASVVTPNMKTVFPVYGEAITCQDGSTKNDCERNACKRLLPHIRSILPNQKIIVLLDALYADGPTIKALQKEEINMNYIIVIKEGYVLEQVMQLRKRDELQEYQWQKDKNTLCKFKWMSNLILNGANQDVIVNYLEYEEYDSRKGIVNYSNKWITDIELNKANVDQVAQAGRTRWKVENETFNTLKNQGYNLEHNYGHGHWYLATIFALIMLLAFFVDQITRAVDTSFEQALKEAKTLRDLRQKVRVLFDFIPTISMNFIYLIIAREIDIRPQFRPKLE